MCLHIVVTHVHTLPLYPAGCGRVLETGVMSSNLSSRMLSLVASLLPQLKNKDPIFLMVEKLSLSYKARVCVSHACKSSYPGQEYKVTLADVDPDTLLARGSGNVV